MRYCNVKKVDVPAEAGGPQQRCNKLEIQDVWTLHPADPGELPCAPWTSMMCV